MTNLQIKDLLVQKVAEDLVGQGININREQLKLTLENKFDIPEQFSVGKVAGKLGNAINLIDTIYTTGTATVGIGQTLSEMKKWNPNSSQYAVKESEMLHGFLSIASNLSGYVPVIGSLISGQLDLANALLQIGTTIVAKYNADIQNALAGYQALQNGTITAIELTRMQIEAMNPNSPEYAQAKSEFNDMLKVYEAIKNLFKICATDSQIAGYINFGHDLRAPLISFQNDLNAAGEYYTRFKELLGNNDKVIIEAQDVKNATQAQVYYDPLIVDLNKNSLYSGDLGNGTHFDNEGDGYKEKTAWIDNGDGLLIRDINQNGVVDNAGELFGDQTLLGTSNQRASSGFSALAQYDQNADGKIDSNDAIFSELGIWKDNGNGITEDGEIVTLADLGVKEINLGYQNVNTVDSNGNSVLRSSTIVMNDGTTYNLGELNFVNDSTDTIQTTPVEISEEIKNTLPEIVASGEMLTLQQAMTLDSSLATLVNNFVQSADSSNFRALAEQILVKWTGCENVVPDSRGAYVNAVQLAVIEKFYGTGYNGVNGANPNTVAAPLLKKAYDNLLAQVEMKLLAQTHLLPYLMSTVSNQAGTDYSGAIRLFEKLKESDSIGFKNLFSKYVSYLYNNGQISTKDKVFNFINAYDGTAIVRDDIFSALTQIVKYNNSSAINFEFSSFFSGNEQNNTINGSTTNDLIYGAAGNDTISAGDGNDILVGGEGNDALYGGTGNDTYIFNRGDGQDTILEYWGNDTVQFGEGITADDIELVRKDRDLYIKIKGSTDSIKITDNYRDPSAYGNNIENIKFADGTVWCDGKITGSIASNVLRSYNNGCFSLHETINAGAGEDTVFALDGNDIITGGIGNDTLYGGIGNDTYIFNQGDGQDVIEETAGNDTLSVAIDYTELIFSRLGDSLRIATAGSEDVITINSWYLSDSYHIENITCNNNMYLTHTQVNLIIQAMASFEQTTGISWEQAISENPDRVSSILSDIWLSKAV